MLKVTRELIKARTPHVEYHLNLRNDVKRIGGGTANNCYSNCRKVMDDAKDKFHAISGWLVQPFDPGINGSTIIQHWWNVDWDGNHFDTTPLKDNGAEYVMDGNLLKFCTENDERLQSHVAMSLFYEDGKFSLLVDEDKLLFLPIPHLKTELLFRYE